MYAVRLINSLFLLQDLLTSIEFTLYDEIPCYTCGAFRLYNCTVCAVKF